MDEVEQLRGLGLRHRAALRLVAERHRLDTEVLSMSHFQWLMIEAGLGPATFLPQ